MLQRNMRINRLKKKANPGAELAALREIERKECAVCGTVIEGLKSKKYCSESCKQKAKYNRKKGAS